MPIARSRQGTIFVLWIGLLSLAAAEPSAQILGSAAPPAPEVTPADWERLRAGEVLLVPADVGGQEGGGRALAHFPASAERVWVVLIDFEAHTEFMPRLQKTENYVQEPGRICTFQELKVLWRTVGYHLDRRIDPARLRVEFALDPTRPNDLAATEGFWQLHPLPDGTTLVSYRVRGDAGRAMPDWLEDRLTRRDIPEAIRSLRRRVVSGGRWTRETPVPEE